MYFEIFILFKFIQSFNLVLSFIVIFLLTLVLSQIFGRQILAWQITDLIHTHKSMDNFSFYIFFKRVLKTLAQPFKKKIKWSRREKEWEWKIKKNNRGHYVLQPKPLGSTHVLQAMPLGSTHDERKHQVVGKKCITYPQEIIFIPVTSSNLLLSRLSFQTILFSECPISLVVFPVSYRVFFLHQTNLHTSLLFGGI